MTQPMLSDISDECLDGASVRTQPPTRAAQSLRPRATAEPARVPERALAALLHDYFEDACARRPEVKSVPAAIWNEALTGPLSDFFSRPGKRFRARLVEASWYLAGRTEPPPAELSWIVEILHAGSLIVDDIEDGSAYRRSAPALHCSYGLPLALNAANWLYFWPSALIERLELDPSVELLLHRSLGRTMLACHEGQALDLSVRVTDLQQPRVSDVVRTATRLKTGSLFSLAGGLGAIAGRAPSSTVRALHVFGEALGAGLQMLDDTGGISSEQRCHKGHEDLLNARATWPWAFAAERLAPTRYERLCALGREVAARERHPEFAAAELREVLGDAPHRYASRHLRRTLSELRQTLGSSSILQDLEQEILLMEASYG